MIFGCHALSLASANAFKRAHVFYAPLLALQLPRPFWLGCTLQVMPVIARRFGADGPYPVRRCSSSQKLPNVYACRGFGCDWKVAEATKISTFRGRSVLSERLKQWSFGNTEMCADSGRSDCRIQCISVRISLRRAMRDEPFPTARPELVRAVHWRHARYGLIQS